jgi:hypothetical protein
MGLRIPVEIEERERDAHPYHGVDDIYPRQIERPKREKIHREVKTGSSIIRGVCGQHQVLDQA